MAEIFTMSVFRIGRLLYVRYFLFPLFVLIRFTNAIVCPVDSAAGSKPLGNARQKICPDFKDEEKQQFCCPSHVVPGSYYCCSEDHLSDMEAREAAEFRKQFIKNNFAVIIIGLVGTIILIVVLTMCLCKNLSFCPMNSSKSTCSTMQATQRYRPVDTLPSKPVAYEAPPPYDCSYEQDPQRRNDWHCLLENEVNDTRQGRAIFH